MCAMHYLTVQDMIWINHRLTGRVNAFRYDALEEATYFQYGYGPSTDLAAQASRFLQGFAKKAPFDSGNEQTGFVGFVAFLRANGKDLKVTPSEARRLMEAPPADWIASAPIRDGAPVHGEPDMRGIIEGVVSEYAETVSAVGAA